MSENKHIWDHMNSAFEDSHVATNAFNWNTIGVPSSYPWMIYSNDKLMKGENMEDIDHLYVAYIVMNDEYRTILEGKVIARSPDSARIKAVKLLEAKEGKNFDVDEVDIILHPIGSLRKRDKVQRVQVVKGDD